jgi:acetyl esterase/lipase
MRFLLLPLVLAAPAAAQTSVPLPRTMSVQAVLALPQARPSEVIRYGEAPSQIVELFLPSPRPEGLLPVAVVVHGGCWQVKVAGPALMHPAATALAARGFAVWNIGYRRADEDGGGYPGTYQDVAAAVDLLAAQAKDRGLDPGRVAFYGHSAGGHLALWAAARHKLPKDSPLAGAPAFRPKGVVAAGSVVNLKEDAWVIKGACRIDPAETLVNPAATDPYADTSPAALLPSGVPVLLVNGVFDGIMFPELALAHATAARKAGDQADISIAPGAGHFEVIAPGQRAFEQVAQALERFTR